MATQHAVLIHKYKDQLVPLPAYEKIVNGLKPNIAGYAVATVGEIMADTQGDVSAPMELHAESSKLNDIMEPAMFDAFQKEFQASDILILLARTPSAEVDERDKQPHTVVFDEDTDEPLVVAFAEGDFSNYNKPKSQRLSEVLMMEEALEQLRETYVASAQEPSHGGFMDFLNDPRCVNEINATISGRGVVKVISCDGVVRSFGLNKEGGQYDWGELSQTYGYSEKGYPERETAQEQPKKKSLFSKFTGKTKAEAAPTLPAPAPTPPAPPPPPPPNPENKEAKPVQDNRPPKSQPVQKDTKPEIILYNEKTKNNPPAGMVWARVSSRLSHKSQKESYEKVLGFCPQKGKHPYVEGWKARPIVLVEANKLPPHFVQPDDSPFPARTDTLAKAAGVGKDTEPKHIRAEGSPPQTNPPGEVNSFRDEWLKRPTVASKFQGVQGIPTLVEINAYEAKHSTFYQKTGLQLSQMYNVEDDDLMDLILKRPYLTRTLIRDLMYGHCRLLQARSQAPQKEQTAEQVKEATRPRSDWGKRKTA